jgi:hypothetical protein
VIEIEACAAEQRIGDAAQIADQRPHPLPLDQLASTTRTPETARLLHPRIKIARAAHRDQGADQGDFRWADPARQDLWPQRHSPRHAALSRAQCP